MLKSRMIAKVLLLVSMLFATPALAFSPDGTCENWSTSAPWGGAAYAEASAFLERFADGSWELVDGRTDSQLLPVEGGQFVLGGMWFDAATPALSDGTYRVRLQVTVWANMYAVPTETDKANHPASSTFVFPESTSGLFECTAPPVIEYGDARTPGYWKNHPEAWKSQTITLGTTSYAMGCLLPVFDLPTRGDVRVVLLHHLIAAKLNLLNNSNPNVVTGYPSATSTVTQTIQAADNYLVSSGTQINCSTGALTGSAPKGADKEVPEALKTALDSYNNNAL